MIASLALATGFVVWNCGGDGGSSQRAAAGRDSSSTEPAQPGTGKKASVATAGETFKPAALQVAIGTTVTWTNEDSVVHTVTSGAQRTPDGKFHTELTERGTTFSFTFNQEGTFAYFCAVHPTMVGEVAVK
jgi:plastocyanin